MNLNLEAYLANNTGMEWWNGLEWNGMVTSWMVLLNFHLLIMTTSEQRPPFNKDRPTFD